MNEQSIKRLMTMILYLGLALLVAALGLALFGQLHVSMGVKGIAIIAVTAGAGLVMLVPSKIFLTLLLMKNSQRHTRQEEQP